MIVCESERLYLREWVPDDWKRFRPLATDPRVLRYIGHGKPWTDEQIKARIASWIEVGRRRGWVLWPVIHRDDAELIGFCGFWDGFAPDVEIGWRLLPEYWGQGLATEAAQAVMEYGFQRWNFPRLISVAQPENKASLRIMEKLGMEFERGFLHEGFEVVCYSKKNPVIRQSQVTGMDLLDRLLGHDSWTTRRLLDLAGTLSDRQLDQEFDIGHRTVRRTFEHIIWNIECWTDLMKGNEVRSRPASNQSFALLKERHEIASSELFQFAREAVDRHRLDETFLDTLDDPPKEKSLGGVIVHLATHGMHHRAQLLVMMRRLGVEGLPEGDALSWELSLPR